MLLPPRRTSHTHIVITYTRTYMYLALQDTSLRIELGDTYGSGTRQQPRETSTLPTLQSTNWSEHTYYPISSIPFSFLQSFTRIFFLFPFPISHFPFPTSHLLFPRTATRQLAFFGSELRKPAVYIAYHLERNGIERTLMRIDLSLKSVSRRSNTNDHRFPH